MADSGQRTEKPTKRRLEKSRKEGQFAASRELMASLQFLTFVTLLASTSAQFLAEARNLARYFFTAAFQIQLTPRAVENMYGQALRYLFAPLFWMGACLFTVALVGQLGSTRLGFSFQKLAPDLNRLN